LLAGRSSEARASAEERVPSDLTFAVRMLAKRPGLSAAAAAMLALGVGANVAIFSVVNGVLLRPLPYRDAERMVRLFGTREQGAARTNVSPLDFLDWEERASSFAALGAFASDVVTDASGDDPVELRGLQVSPGFFRVLDVPPLLGRGFRAAEARAGAAPTIVLGEELWRTRFGADPQILGRVLPLEGRPSTVVGVMPSAALAPLYGVEQPAFWSALAIDPARHGRGGHWLRCIGRLRPGVSPAAAQAEMDSIMRQLESEHPRTNGDRGVALVGLRESLVGDVRPALLALLGAVGLVLLSACSNVANLLLARATSRETEIAVRAALGAGRGRLTRQLLIESLVLAGVGGALALLVASWGIEWLVAAGPPELPRLIEIRLDGRALGLTLALSILTGLAFGSLPALRGGSRDLSAVLRGDSRGTGRARAGRLRRLLVVSEMALALILLSGAGLLVRSFWNLSRTDPGFGTDRALTARLALPESRYPQARLVHGFYAELLERLARLPAVESVGAVNMGPLGEAHSCDGFSLGDRPPFSPSEDPCVESRTVLADYFGAMRIPLVAGRRFDERDRLDSEPVVMINQSMAHRYWPGQEAIGKRFKWGAVDSSDPWRTIVGVVGDVRHFGLDRAAAPEVYMPHVQYPFPDEMMLVARSDVDPRALAEELRGAVRAMDARLPLTRVATLEQVVSDSLAGRRFPLALVAGFAALALLLAVAGMFSVMSYAVNQRMRELGVRMALGAGRREIYRMILGQGLSLAALGIGGGLAGAVGAAHLLSSLLHGVSPTDPLTYLFAAVTLVATAAVACVVPARRATRVDPLVALRQE
jgi:putative ABC transport system permease protein